MKTNELLNLVRNCRNPGVPDPANEAIQLIRAAVPRQAVDIKPILNTREGTMPWLSLSICIPQGAHAYWWISLDVKPETNSIICRVAANVRQAAHGDEGALLDEKFDTQLDVAAAQTVEDLLSAAKETILGYHREVLEELGVEPIQARLIAEQQWNKA